MPTSLPPFNRLRDFPAYARTLGHRLRREAFVVVGRIWPKRNGLTGDPTTDVVAMLPEIETSQAALLDFGQETDAEFTELAQGLSELNTKFSTIREQAEALDNILHQRDNENVLATAYQVYKSSVDLVHSSMGIALSEQQQMAEVETALTHACRVKVTFTRNNLLLRILTMSIRMEASRLEPESRSVFLNVAAAIAGIDEKILQTTTTAFSRIEQVIEEARIEREALHGLEQSLQGRAQHSIGKLQQELADYKTSLIPCAELSCKVGELFSQTGPLTLQIITSLQYQDIVRQQLEHVASGFEDITVHLRELDQAAESKCKPELGFIHHAACVQLAHLTSSRQDIEKAGREVAGGISRMLDLGGQLIGHFGGMEKAAQAAFGRSKISELFGHEIHQLTLIADQSEKANEKISRLVERIDEVVRVFSQEIGSHEFEVKIVSLNAQIAAARMSSADALNKLAEESSLAAEANAEATAELTRELQGCLSKLQGIKNDADQFMRIVTREKDELQRNAATVSAQLSSLGAQIGTRSSEVSRQFASVHTSQNELLGRLKFSELVESTYGPAAELCEQLRKATRAYALPEDLTDEGMRKLTAHKNRYTMVRENELHTSALPPSVAPGEKPVTGVAGDINLFDSPVLAPQNAQSTSAPEAPLTPTPQLGPAAQAAPAPKEDLGDGIELF